MKTTLTVRKQTAEKLQSLGKMGQSFDDVITELINKVEPINDE